MMNDVNFWKTAISCADDFPGRRRQGQRFENDLSNVLEQDGPLALTLNLTYVICSLVCAQFQVFRILCPPKQAVSQFFRAAWPFDLGMPDETVPVCVACARSSAAVRIHESFVTRSGLCASLCALQRAQQQAVEYCVVISMCRDVQSLKISANETS
jgi:hypothetical protein